MDKAELLTGDGDASAAVRLAQGETHVIRQTKEWLSQHGVSLAALQRLATAGPAAAKAAERSRTLILVKNIASGVTQSELSAAFAKHGQLGHVMLAPANTLALVEFLEVGAAKRAFRALAYSKLRDAPLFLEWAPVGLIGADGATDGDEASAGTAATAAGATAAGATAEGEDEGDGDGEGCTLFVKNLNFKTDSAALRSHFEKRWNLRSAVVVQKRDTKKGAAAGATVSMGYGFVEFKSAADAQAALRQYAGMRLDEHALQLKVSTRSFSGAAAGGGGGEGARGAATKGAATSTIMVRNMPFEANKREVRELFGAFGQLKTVRLPKKFDGTHRGFAFVEFSTKAEATKAMDALQSTHFYGRHLVLQYAKAEQSVEGLRDKLRDQLNGEAAAAARAKGKKKPSGDAVDDLDF